MTTTTENPHDASTPKNRDLGEQPLLRLMKEHQLSAHDLVSASPEPITHKMVARACKGRWLTAKTKNKIITAFSAATKQTFTKKDLFTY
ncbi:MAG: hypothetical protein JJU29_20160 [Verrucomicrobia bacterium]|nr:hypothetical protein [Verrucomicrobiota bacterium]MCH8513975.1 hypothetical protein [Kiritimatiellia bacterium]